jgi:hypothetical protein
MVLNNLDYNDEGIGGFLCFGVTHVNQLPAIGLGKWHRFGVIQVQY